MVYVPGGVLAGGGLVTTFVPPHPASKPASSMRANRRGRFLLRDETEHKHMARGKSPKASKAVGVRLNGRVLMSEAAERVPAAVVVIANVAAIGFLPSRVARSGVTVQVAPSGTPAHSVAIAPMSPLTGVSVTCVLKVSPARICEDDC